MKNAKLILCSVLLLAQSSFSMDLSSIFPVGSETEQQIKQVAWSFGLLAAGAAFAHIKFEVWPKLSGYCSKKN